jgi:hypothetical protein
MRRHTLTLITIVPALAVGTGKIAREHALNLQEYLRINMIRHKEKTIWEN